MRPTVQPEPHFPSEDAPAAYVCRCPYCRRDLTGFCLALKAPTGDVVLVAEPVKCRFCGRYLLYRRTASPVLVPP